MRVGLPNPTNVASKANTVGVAEAIARTNNEHEVSVTCKKYAKNIKYYILYFKSNQISYPRPQPHPSTSPSPSPSPRLKSYVGSDATALLGEMRRQRGTRSVGGDDA